MEEGTQHGVRSLDKSPEFTTNSDYALGEVTFLLVWKTINTITSFHIFHRIVPVTSRWGKLHKTSCWEVITLKLINVILLWDVFSSHCSRSSGSRSERDACVWWMMAKGAQHTFCDVTWIYVEVSEAGSWESEGSHRNTEFSGCFPMRAFVALIPCS